MVNRSLPVTFGLPDPVVPRAEQVPIDARHNVLRIGRILMARGHDAADVALSTSFGPSVLPKFQVVTDELPQ